MSTGKSVMKHQGFAFFCVRLARRNLKKVFFDVETRGVIILNDFPNFSFSFSEQIVVKSNYNHIAFYAILFMCVCWLSISILDL